MGLESADLTDTQRLTWTITHRKRVPLLIAIDGLMSYGLLILNGESINILTPGTGDRFVLQPDQLRRGKNVIQLAIVGDMKAHAADLRRGTTIFIASGSLTERASWAFANWEPPPQSAFESITTAKPTPALAARFKGKPIWWRATFTADRIDRALFFDATGLSKGQLFLNGHNVGRYFVASHAGKPVPPQSLYDLPAQWLNPGQTNELLIFDEHGFTPTKAKLTYTPPKP